MLDEVAAFKQNIQFKKKILAIILGYKRKKDKVQQCKLYILGSKDGKTLELVELIRT